MMNLVPKRCRNNILYQHLVIMTTLTENNWPLSNGVSARPEAPSPPVLSSHSAPSFMFARKVSPKAYLARGPSTPPIGESQL